MRFKFIVKAIDAGDIGKGWRVRLVDPDTDETPVNPATGQPFSPEVRDLRYLGGELGTADAFPLPPEKEVQGVGANEPHHALVNAADAAPLATVYARITARIPDVKRGDMKGFGRYLFATLIGDEWWAQLNEAARPQGRKELALAFDPEDHVMNRLPWEMMREGDHFLGGLSYVSMMRYVSGVGHDVEEIESPPRVLFVVGSKLTGDKTDAIRPSAEYLGLLRNLKFAGLGLRHQLLLEATPDKLAAAVRDFRPTVVHFICHGNIDENTGGVLVLLDDKGEPQNLSAESIFQHLVYERPRATPEAERETTRPQLVVLNACYTAGAGDLLLDDMNLQQAGQLTVPLAVELVRMGVPVVIGMGGRVADQACRLFTRRFYQALLEDAGGDVVYSGAVGRRAGIIGSGDETQATVDWAMPVLFMAEGVKAGRLKVRVRDAGPNWEQLASSYEATYPAFCGRLDVLQMYDLLMADAATQRLVLRGGRDFRVVAVTSRDADSKGPGRPRYGRSWVLRELTAKAARDGHVPLLVDKHTLGTGKRWPPKNLDDLLYSFKIASQITADRLGAGEPAWKWTDVLAGLRPDKPGDAGKPLPDDAPPDLKKIYNKNPTQPVVVGVAVRLDLIAFLESVRGALPAGERARCRMLLLVDDVHQMSSAAENLLDGILGKLGLLSGDAADIRVVFTHAEKATKPQTVAVEAINDWLGTNNAEQVFLEKFEQPLVSRLAYENFLFNWKDLNKKTLRLVPRSDRPMVVELFFEQLATFVKEVPSNFEASAVTDLIIGSIQNEKLRPFRVASDDELYMKITD